MVQHFDPMDNISTFELNKAIEQARTEERKKIGEWLDRSSKHHYTSQGAIGVVMLMEDIRILRQGKLPEGAE